MRKLRGLSIFTLLWVLSACMASTTFQAPTADVALTINRDASLDLSKPVSTSYKTTSFGQYRFKVEREGSETFYGLVPLKFNGGYLATDILLFAPAMFFNLREFYPIYEFDIDKGVIKYRIKSSDSWTVYKPSSAETNGAKRYFGQ